MRWLSLIKVIHETVRRPVLGFLFLRFESWDLGSAHPLETPPLAPVIPFLARIHFARRDYTRDVSIFMAEYHKQVTARIALAKRNKPVLICLADKR